MSIAPLKNTNRVKDPLVWAYIDTPCFIEFGCDGSNTYNQTFGFKLGGFIYGMIFTAVLPGVFWYFYARPIEMLSDPFVKMPTAEDGTTTESEVPEEEAPDL